MRLVLIALRDSSPYSYSGLNKLNGFARSKCAFQQEWSYSKRILV
jgi:hypothetical protein